MELVQRPKAQRVVTPAVAHSILRTKPPEEWAMKAVTPTSPEEEQLISRVAGQLISRVVERPTNPEVERLINPEEEQLINRVVTGLINRGANNPVVVLQTNPDNREAGDLHLHREYHRVLFTLNREPTPDYREVVG